MFYNLSGILLTGGSWATYWTILRNGAIPLPLAIIISGSFYGTLKRDWNVLIRKLLGSDWKYVLVRPF